MTSIVVQVGQCGNQIGQDFWKQSGCEINQTESAVYKNGDGKLRSVHVDSEPKVIGRLRQQFKDDEIRNENILAGKRGRGSNWALGYHGTRHGAEDAILGESLEVIRREVERCSSFCGIIMMHSLSGGTGSGLGSHLTELVRDEYPLGHLINCVVAPHRSGESCLQHYNTLLSTAWLSRYSDCVLLFDNDEVLRRVEKQLRAHTDRCASFAHMNRHISACLAGLFLPTDSLCSASGTSIGLEPWELVRSLCPMPPLKYLHANFSAKSKSSWEQMAGNMMHSIVKHDPSGKPYRSLANLVVARGDSNTSFSQVRAQIEARVRSAYHTVPWNPYPVDSWTCSTNSLGGRDKASVTMAANYSHVTTYFSDVMDKAWQKYQAGAYLHWYKQYGCEKQTFDEAFDTVQSVVDEYAQAVT